MHSHTVSSAILESEFSESFVKAMKNRMVVSFHKYGPIVEAFGRIDWLESLQQRILKYMETGNSEYLVDVANFAMIQFMQDGPAKFKPTDSSGSPGRTWKPDEFDSTVEVSQRANDGTPQ